MRKKRRVFLCCLMTLLMAFVMAVPMSVSAAENVAKIGDKGYGTLQEAVEAVSTDGTETKITLLEDVTDSNWVSFGDDKNIILDLNGHTLTSEGLILYEGDLTLQNGTLIGSSGQAINVFASDNSNIGNYNSLTISDDVTVEAAFAVILREAPNTKVAYGSQIDVYGTLNGNLWVMGNIQNTDNLCEINIRDGAEVNVDTKTGTGIALNGAAKLNIGNATITGGTGVEVRAGELVVNGAVITGKADSISIKPNGSGVTTLGVGIAVAQHTTKLPISVTIKDGKISGCSAFYESDPQGNDLAEKINIVLENGEYETINGGTNAVYSENIESFITGGTYSSDVGNYISDEVAILVDSDGEGNAIYNIIGNDDALAMLLGATYKSKNSETGAVYYYINEGDKEEDAERIGYAVDFYLLTPSGEIENLWDTIAVPEGESINAFLKENFEYAVEDPSKEGYEFLGWYKGKEGYDWDGNGLVDFAFGDKFSFDSEVNADMEVFSAWQKEGEATPVGPTTPAETTPTEAATTDTTVNEVQTGDDSHMGIVLIMMTLAAAVAVGAVTVKRKAN